MKNVNYFRLLFMLHLVVCLNSTLLTHVFPADFFCTLCYRRVEKENRLLSRDGN